MNGSRMGFFSKIYYSISGFDNYKYFVMQRTGKAVVYLLLLSLIISLIGLVGFVSQQSKMINSVYTDFVNKLPDFILENGKLRVSGDMPIIIDDGASTVIIDTSGTTDESILDNYNNAILILQERMIQKNYANKRVTDFSMLQGARLAKSDLQAVFPLIKWVMLILYILLPPFIIAGRFLSALLTSLIGIIINAIMNTGLQYRDIFSISAYSLTLPLIICTLLDFAGVPFVLSTLVFYCISGIYIWGALNSIKRRSGVSEIPPAE